MNNNRFQRFFSDSFLVKTSTITLILIMFYIIEWITQDFVIQECIYVSANFIYIPCVFIWGRKALVPYLIGYAVILIFVIAFMKTALFNNHSAVFVICIAGFIDKRVVKFTPFVYIVVVLVAFIFNNENITHLCIHLLRSTWYLFVVEYVTKVHFKRTTLNLTEEEKQILDELEKCGNIKGISFKSRNTVSKKIKEAKQRNGLPDTKEGTNQLRSIYRQMIKS